MNETIKNGLLILNFAIKNNLSAKSASKELGFGKNYVSDIVRRLEDYLLKGSCTQKEHDSFKDLHEEYISLKEKNKITTNSSNSNTREKKSTTKDSSVEYDAYADDNYDDRSSGHEIRGEENKITHYEYRILIKNQPSLEGSLTREEMDMVYRLYSNMDGAGLTVRTVSRYFKHLTFRDFKRILRAFNITKSSVPFAPHVLEETTEEEKMNMIIRSKEDSYLKRWEEDRSKLFEQKFKETYKELFELKKVKNIFSDIINNVDLSNITPFNIEKRSVNNEIALFVYVSDMHVGAHNTDLDLFLNDFNSTELKTRLTKTLQDIQKTGNIYGRFDKIIIVNMGDELDGYNGQTTRGGHPLTQNLNNRGQFNVYVKSMIEFFVTLHSMDVTNNIEFISVGTSNHSGDFGYISNKCLEYVLTSKFPDMTVRVCEKFIEHFTYGIHTFIITHGKDDKHMKHGFPLNLDAKTETYFNGYISNFNIHTPSINVIKGDLHQSASQKGKRFRYKNCPSLYGGSEWMHTNFGYTQPAVDFDIVFKNETQILEGTISLIS